MTLFLKKSRMTRYLGLNKNFSPKMVYVPNLSSNKFKQFSTKTPDKWSKSLKSKKIDSNLGSYEMAINHMKIDGDFYSKTQNEVI